MKKEKKPLKPKTKLALCQAGSITSMVTPLAVVMGINFNEYFSIGTYTSVRLSFGAVLGLILALLMVKGKTEFLKGLWGYLVVFLLAFFLKPIIDDILLITGMALLGKTVDAVFFERLIKKFRAECDMTQSAQINANAMKEAMAEALKETLSGRV